MVFQRWCVTVKNITVLGSGVMGHGIAQVSATAGYNVVLRDIKQEFLDKAMEKIKWSLDKMVTKEKISKEEADGICLLYTSPSPRDQRGSRMPSSA